jgi:hypothetical protein
MHTGLSNFDCGIRTDWYAYTFVGSISAITSIENDEKKIQIVPEEVFHGNPPSPLTVFTSEAACLPSLAVGDRWLFFLRKEKGEPIVLDYYGNDSRPVADAKEQIETLRRLKNIGNFGIVRGYVLRGHQGQGISNATVVAHRVPDDLKFNAITDSNGRYEFQPLPTGKYKFTVDPIGSFRLDDSQDDDGLDVTRGSCWEEVLAHSPHVELGGHVRRLDDSPMPRVDILNHQRRQFVVDGKNQRRGIFQYRMVATRSVCGRSQSAKCTRVEKWRMRRWRVQSPARILVLLRCARPF